MILVVVEEVEKVILVVVKEVEMIILVVEEVKEILENRLSFDQDG